MDFVCIVLGGDMNSYGVARAFYEKYNKKTIILGQRPIFPTAYSKIIEGYYYKDVLNDKIHVIDDESLLKQIKNGAIIKNEYNSNDIMFQYNNEIIAIYKTYEKDNNMLKPYKMFL